jgi:hypothetical protein
MTQLGISAAFEFLDRAYSRPRAKKHPRLSAISSSLPSSATNGCKLRLSGRCWLRHAWGKCFKRSASGLEQDNRFSYDCMWRAEARSKKGKSACGVYLPDLEHKRPPDLPPRNGEAAARKGQLIFTTDLLRCAISTV